MTNDLLGIFERQKSLATEMPGFDRKARMNMNTVLRNSAMERREREQKLVIRPYDTVKSFRSLLEDYSFEGQARHMAEDLGGYATAFEPYAEHSACLYTVLYRALEHITPKDDNDARYAYDLISDEPLLVSALILASDQSVDEVAFSIRKEMVSAGITELTWADDRIMDDLCMGALNRFRTAVMLTALKNIDTLPSGRLTIENMINRIAPNSMRTAEMRSGRRPVTINDIYHQRSTTEDNLTIAMMPAAAKLKQAEYDDSIAMFLMFFLRDMYVYSTVSARMALTKAKRKSITEEVIGKTKEEFAKDFIAEINRIDDERKQRTRGERVDYYEHFFDYVDTKAETYDEKQTLDVHWRILEDIVTRDVWREFSMLSFKEFEKETDDSKIDPEMLYRKAIRRAKKFFGEKGFSWTAEQVLSYGAQEGRVYEITSLMERIYLSEYAVAGKQVIIKEQADSEPVTKSDLETENEKLKAEIERLKHERDSLIYDIGRRDARIATLEGKVVEDTEEDQEEEQEIVTLVQPAGEDIPSFDEMVEYLKQLNCIVAGGHLIWHNKLRKYFPDWRYLEASDLSLPPTLKGYDFVFEQTKHMSHILYDHLQALLAGHNEKLAYIAVNNIEMTIREMYLAARNQQETRKTG